MSNSSRYIIRGLSTLCAVGVDHDNWRTAMSADGAPCVQFGAHNLRPISPLPIFPLAIFPLHRDAEELVARELAEPRFSRLDRSVLLALAAARRSIKSVPAGRQIGVVSIGSSRGPTNELERSINRFGLGSERLSALTSPITTAGNLSSWVAQLCLSEAGDDAPEPVALSTSMTCSSAFHSLLVSLSFLKSGMAEAALFGGSESCLTPYTIAQLTALNLYTQERSPWPSQPLHIKGGDSNRVALGEAAGTALLLSDDQAQPGDIQLLGIGWALEDIPSPTGINDAGLGFERAMRMALSTLPKGLRVDAAIAHAPGSELGDNAELQALGRVFGELPVCSTKHLTGHSYGASGMVSLSLAYALMTGTAWSGLPYPNTATPVISGTAITGMAISGTPRVVLINTAGFGGNVISIIVGIGDALGD